MSPDFMLYDCQLPFKLGLLEEFPLHSQSMVEAPIQKALWISFYAFSFVFPSFLFFFLLWGNNMVLQVRTLVLILDNLPFNPILPRVIISSWEIKLAHCAILSPPENGWIILNNNLNWAHCICEYGMGFVEMCWHVSCHNNYWAATGQVAGQALPSNFRKHFQVTLHICVQPQRLLLSQPQSSSFSLTAGWTLTRRLAFLLHISHLEITTRLHLLLHAWFRSSEFCPQMDWGCFYCKGMPRTDNKCVMFLFSPMALKVPGACAQTPLPMSSSSISQFTVTTQAVFQCSPYQPSHTSSGSNSLSIKWQ